MNLLFILFYFTIYGLLIVLLASQVVGNDWKVCGEYQFPNISGIWLEELKNYKN
jgi:hypothetical protein